MKLLAGKRSQLYRTLIRTSSILDGPVFFMQIITPVNERLNQLDDVLKNGEFSGIHQQNDNQ